MTKADKINRRIHLRQKYQLYNIVSEVTATNIIGLELSCSKNKAELLLSQRTKPRITMESLLDIIVNNLG